MQGCLITNLGKKTSIHLRRKNITRGNFLMTLAVLSESLFYIITNCDGMYIREYHFLQGEKVKWESDNVIQILLCIHLATLKDYCNRDGVDECNFAWNYLIIIASVILQSVTPNKMISDRVLSTRHVSWEPNGSLSSPLPRVSASTACICNFPPCCKNTV